MLKSKNMPKNAWKLTSRCSVKSASTGQKHANFINSCEGTVVCIMKKRSWQERYPGTSQSFWSVQMAKLLCTSIQELHQEIWFLLSQRISTLKQLLCLHQKTTFPITWQEATSSPSLKKKKKKKVKSEFRNYQSVSIFKSDYSLVMLWLPKLVTVIADFKVYNPIQSR